MSIHAFRPTRRRTRSLAGASTAAVLAGGLFAAGLQAQSGWTNPDEGASLAVELLRPSFSDDELDFSGATGAGFVTFRAPVAARWGVVADLPFARAAWALDEEDGSSNLVGNPYLGVEWRTTDRLTTELGVRVPVGNVEELEWLPAGLVGMAGELERLEAFVPETFGIYAMAGYRAAVAPGLELGLRGGPAFLGGNGGPDDLMASYTGQLWYGTGPLTVGSGITGRANLTTDDEDIDRASHQWIVAGDYRFGALRPGLQVRVPLDSEARDVTGYTVGVTLGWSVP